MINLAVILGGVADTAIAGIVFGAWRIKKKFDKFNDAMSGMMGIGMKK